MHNSRLLFVSIFLLIVDDNTALPSKGKNLRPIIGILSQEYWETRGSTAPNGSYIAASYVKSVEASGARVVPIFIGQELSYYEDIVQSVNGILLPGGGVDFWAKGGYGEASKTLYELALRANEKGTNFPLYGICLGFEALALMSGDMEKDVLEPINGTENIPLRLDFTPESKSSSLFSETPSQIIGLLRKRSFTSNHHSKCFTKNSLERHNLTGTWRVLSTSQVRPGETRFISSMEHALHPQIFGTQFHPEKPAFEWNKTGRDSHSAESLIANRWFVDYFVEQARQNHNKFSDEMEEKKKLIYNFQPIYSGSDSQLNNLQSFYRGFEQIYRFQYNDISQ